MGDFTEAVEKMLAQAKEAETLREEAETLRESLETAEKRIEELEEKIEENDELRKENNMLRNIHITIFDLLTCRRERPVPVYVDFTHPTTVTANGAGTVVKMPAGAAAEPAPKPAEAPATEPAKKTRKRKEKAAQPAALAPEPAAPAPDPAPSPLAIPASPRLKNFAALPVAPAGASADGEEQPKKRTNFEELFLKLEAKAPSKGQQQRAALREQEREEEAPAPKPADDPEGGPDQPGRLSLADLRRYIDANDGRCGALVTVVAGSAEGARRTFRFRAKTKAKLAAHERKAYFLDVLSGPDNGVDYSGCGSLVLLANGGCEYRPYGEVSATTRAAATLLAGGLNTQAGASPLPAGVEFWHQGTCARCGRSLTVPESIASGLGPECLAAVGG